MAGTRFVGKDILLFVDTRAEGGAAPVWTDVAHQKDLEIDDSKDTATASSKNGGGFASNFPTIRSISFTLNALRCYDEPTQKLLYDAYDSDDEILVQFTVPSEIAGTATDEIHSARALITSWNESFPETDMATLAAGVSMQEKWNIALAAA